MHAIYLFGGAKIFLFLLTKNYVFGLTIKSIGKLMKAVGE